MKYDLSKFDELVEQKLLRKVEKGNLVLYNYTDLCVYERAWNDYTRVARGIIFDKTTGELVAKPFPKFFNLGEMPETYLTSLPDEPYEVTEKVDGSLGIIFHYNNEWHVATRGSLSSDQAIKAKEMLPKYRMDKASVKCTYLVEIVYPENKIVVNYGDKEELVLLGIYNNEFQEELRIFEWAAILKMRAVKNFNYSIGQMIELQKTIPKDEEGFVVRYESGLRVKIKGAEYMRIHKIISQLSPLSAWECMTNGVVNKDYLTQIPEEYRKDFQVIVDSLEMSYKSILQQIKEDVELLPKVDITTKEGLKAIGLYTQGDHKLNHAKAMFPYLLNKQGALEKYIMNRIRPTGNVL